MSGRSCDALMWKPPSPTCKWSLSTYIIYFIYYLWWFSCRLMSCLSLDALRFSLISKYVWSNYLQFPFHFIDLQMWLSGGKLFSLAYYMSGQTICNFHSISLISKCDNQGVNFFHWHIICPVKLFAISNSPPRCERRSSWRSAVTSTLELVLDLLQKFKDEILW